MTKAEYMKFHEDCCQKLVAITKAKNADYTGIGDDPFANFCRVEALGIASTEQGFLTRMLDKFCRLISFAQKGVLEVKDESVEDSLLDLANYSILLAGYIRTKRERARAQQA
jgi:hypothetical protein